MRSFDVIIVGAGPSGSTAALVLAKKGFKVLLLERGEFPGAKNMFGGMVPNCPVFNEIIPDFWDHAPWERHVVRRTTTVFTESSSVSMDFKAPVFNAPNYHGFTLFRPVFDKWYAGKALEEGAVLLTGVLAEDLLWEGDSVSGVKLGLAGGEITSKIVIACDGVLSFMAKKAGLRQEFSPSHMGVGIRAFYRLSEQEINARFNITGRQGVAQGYLGCTEGIRGGAFLYTQLDGVSVGFVLHIDSLRKSGLLPYELLEKFVEKDPVRNYLRDAKLIDYSAHVIPESPYKNIPRLYRGGMLVAGDAAALSYTNGLNQDGMNMAVMSGYLAAQSAAEAFEKGDFSEKTLSSYKDRLESSFVLKDIKTFDGAIEFMHNDRLFSLYPEVIAKMVERIYSSDGTPKKSFGKLAWSLTRQMVPLKSLLIDLWKGGKSFL